jgi:hypothetical protein
MRVANAIGITACAIGVVLSDLPANAQSQPLVVAPPGTRFYTSGGNWHEIDSVDGAVVRTISNTLAVREWLGFCEWASADTQLDRHAADSLWPLENGKSLTVEKGRGERRWKTTLKVAGTEPIKIPAGTFTTWIVEAEEVGLTHTSRVITRCWYAPEAGVVVKRRVEVKEGNSPTSAYEVVKIERQDRSKVAEFRPPPFGTTFDTTRGSFRVDGAEGTTLFQKSDDPRLNAIWLGGLHNTVASDPFVGKAGQEVARLWPLQVGKSVSFDFSRPSGGVWTNRISVERVEPITVQAGTYSTFVIKWHEQAINGPFNATYVYWWSPALGFPIKRDVQFSGGTAVRSPYELRKVIPPSR